jgi:hypothetical protein
VVLLFVMLLEGDIWFMRLKLLPVLVKSGMEQPLVLELGLL